MSLILSLSRSRTVLTGLGAMLLLQCGHLSAQTLVVDRYTVLAATPTAAQQDLLGGIDRIMFPVDVLPLPDAHRRLGPMPLRLALQTLAGPAWRLLEDPVYRLVAFERCPNFAEVR